MKLHRVFLGFALVFSLGAAKVIEAKFSHVVSENTPKGKAAEFFAKRVGELTNGQLKVTLFPNSQLYTDAAVLKALKLNNVQFAAPSFSKFTSVMPQIQLFDLPFLFRDNAHLHHVMDGEVGDALKKIANDKGYISLAYWDAGFKQFSTNKAPVTTPTSIEGQKIRIMSSRVLEEQMKVVKVNPQILPFSEVYSALQQGVVDGAENPLSNIMTKKFYEVQSSVTMSNHGYLGYLVVASDKFWKKLPKDMQEAVVKAMKEATDYERKLTDEYEMQYVKELENYAKSSGKLKIILLSPEQKKQWQDVMRTIYPKFYDEIGKDLIEKAIATK
ncbi:MAG: DctP family TRAP transporter solute-binding subunit [Helicobacteraceae bacterium]